MTSGHDALNDLWYIIRQTYGMSYVIGTSYIRHRYVVRMTYYSQALGYIGEGFGYVRRKNTDNGVRPT